MTNESLALFLELARDAGNWCGTPLLDISKEQRGNLTDLKKRNLLVTFKDEGLDWVQFTGDGKKLALEHNINIGNF